MRGVALVTASAALVAVLACAAFDSSRVEPVVLSWASDTVLTHDSTVALVIGVSANGVPIPNPRLAVSSSDTTVVRVNAAGDSLFANGLGRASITVRLESSVLTDSLPTLIQSLRVRP